MRRLFCLTAFLVVLFSGLIIISRNMETQQGRSKFSMLFRNPDGSSCERPCLLGMRPGVTRFEEAHAIVRNHPLSRDSLSQSDLSKHELSIFASDSINIIIYTNTDEILYECRLMLRGIILGDLVNLLGEPAWVIASRSSAYLYYPSDGVTLYIINPPLSRLFVLDIYAPVNVIAIFLTTNREFIKPRNAKSWRGFVNALRYNE